MPGNDKKCMNHSSLKIIVAHPGRQHSFRVATALQHHGMLQSYATTVYNKDNSFVMNILRLFLKGDNFRRAQKRKCPDVTDDKVLQFCGLRGLLLLLLLRLDKKQTFARWYMRRISRIFQRKLAHYIISKKIKYVISYDTNSSLLFDILSKEAPEIIRIIDDAHPCRNYLHKVYNDIIESSGPFVKTYKACGYLLDKEFADSFGNEAKKADIHIVASSFSKQAALFNGIPESHIIFAPYGVDNKAFHPWEKDYRHNLKVLFVGEINQRKGIYQILEAAKALQPAGGIEFNLVGTGQGVAPELYTPYMPYVNFLGRVPFEKLQELYGTSHVFIFPSMGEGFGLVIPEALSSGLPVIASKNCAGPDLIQDGYNGFLIDAGDTQGLIRQLEWFMNNMQILPQMQENAIQSVQDLTWEKYENNLVEQLKEKISLIERERGLHQEK